MGPLNCIIVSLFSCVKKLGSQRAGKKLVTTQGGRRGTFPRINVFLFCFVEKMGGQGGGGKACCGPLPSIIFFF